MFAQLKERFTALKEMHTVRGLTWRFPPLFWRLTYYTWCGALGQLALHVLLPKLNHHPMLVEIRSIIEVNLIATAMLVVVYTIINAWRNLPPIVAFLRDPTFENE